MKKIIYLANEPECSALFWRDRLLLRNRHILDTCSIQSFSYSRTCNLQKKYQLPNHYINANSTQSYNVFIFFLVSRIVRKNANQQKTHEDSSPNSRSASFPPQSAHSSVSLGNSWSERSKRLHSLRHAPFWSFSPENAKSIRQRLAPVISDCCTSNF